MIVEMGEIERSWGTQDHGKPVYAIELATKLFQRAICFVLHRLVMLGEFECDLVRNDTESVPSQPALLRVESVSSRRPTEVYCGLMLVKSVHTA
jgi:hypothetical protein